MHVGVNMAKFLNCPECSTINWEENLNSVDAGCCFDCGISLLGCAYEDDGQTSCLTPYVFNKSVDHPSHYQSESGLEVIDVIDAFELNFELGNAIKYILRAYKKGKALEDLEKAKWYLNREIANLIKGAADFGEKFESMAQTEKQVNLDDQN